MMKSIVPTGRVRIEWEEDVASIVHSEGDLIPFSEEFIKELYDGEMEEGDTFAILDSFSFSIADCIFYYVGEDFLSLSVVYRIFKPE